MDNKTTVEDLKNIIKNFCEEREWDQFHHAKDLGIGIVTEAAELIDLFRFKTNEEIDAMFFHEQKRERISEEVSDIFFFLLRFAQKNNLDLTEELKKKLLKNNEKYPVDKFKGSNKKYTEV